MTLVVQNDGTGRLVTIGRCSIRVVEGARWLLVAVDASAPRARMAVHEFFDRDTGTTDRRIEAPAGFPVERLPGWKANETTPPVQAASA